ncbi:MAG: GGDEF domain-containing protein [Spirochaetales bacterium]|nr:GGDEF domain-containing protein [Spirochaetales bacterium]
MTVFLEVASFFIAFWAIEVSFRIIRTNPDELTYRSFFVIGILSGLYGIFYGLIIATRDENCVRIIYRISVFTWGVFPTAFLIFIKRFIYQINNRKFSNFYFIFYIPSLFFVILGVSGNLLAKDFRAIPSGWQELDLYTTAYDYLYLVYIVGVLIYVSIDLIVSYYHLKERKKKRLTFKVMFPMLIVFILSVTSNLLIKLNNDLAVPTLGHLWIGLFVIGVGYFILKARFLTFTPQLLADDILELMTDIAVVADNDNSVLQISRTGLEFWGIRSNRTRRAKRHSLKLNDLFENIIEFPEPGKYLEGITEFRGGDGKKVHYSYILKSITDYFDRPYGVFLIARNAEEIVKLERRTGKLKTQNTRLKVLSETDPLTGLLNRYKFDTLFDSEIKKAARYGQSLSVIMLDLDDFKKVNDTCGHLVGDQVLLEVAKVAKEGLREFDFICRWGGEEFMVLCPNSDLKGTRNLAERLRQKISEIEIYEIDNITASFGIAELKSGENKNALISRADDRLYLAKERGKNVIVGRN